MLPFKPSMAQWKKKLLKIDKWKKATKFVVETFQVLKFK